MGQARETFGEARELYTARDFWMLPLKVKKVRVRVRGHGPLRPHAALGTPNAGS